MSSWCSYSSSKGVKLHERAAPNHPTPVNNYLSGDSKSHVYNGPGYYVPSEHRWIPYHEHRSLPMDTRRDAILIESEDKWREFQAARDKIHQPGGISLSGHPEMKHGAPASTLVPFHTHAWNRPWSGAGHYVLPMNGWIHERRHEAPMLPDASKRFYNEEDWIKYKYMTQHPTIKS